MEKVGFRFRAVCIRGHWYFYTYLTEKWYPFEGNMYKAQIIEYYNHDKPYVKHYIPVTKRDVDLTFLNYEYKKQA